MDPEIRSALNLAKKVKSALEDKADEIEGHSFDEDMLGQNLAIDMACNCGQ